jgi:hypothetical protein
LDNVSFSQPCIYFRDRITQEDEVSLLTKLADAFEQCKDTHANLLAIAVKN